MSDGSQHASARSRPGRPRGRPWLALTVSLGALCALGFSMRYSLSLLDESEDESTTSSASATPALAHSLTDDLYALERAVRASPGDGDLRLQLAEAYIHAGKARLAYSLLTRDPPDRPETPLFQGWALMQLGEMRAAEERLIAARESMPESAQPGVSLSGLHKAMGRWEEAERIAEETYEAHPDDYGAQISFGESLFMGSMIGPAKTVLERAISTDPDRPEAYALMAQATKIEHATALHYAQLALDRDEECLPALLVVGQLYADRTAEAGSFERAESALLKAADAHPGRPGPHFHLGILYRRNGRMTEAAEELERAVKLGPDAPSSLAALVGVYEELGRRGKAAELRPGLRHLQEFVDTESDLRRALAYEPTNTSARLDLAEHYLRHGKYESAFQAACEIPVSDPNGPRAKEVMAQAEASSRRD